MGQETLVLKLPRSEHDELKHRLEGGSFEFRPVPHSVFSVKGQGVVATLYRSGKLVIQGADPGAFATLYLDGRAEVASSTKARPAEEAAKYDEVAMVGSDESGKGDYFGPLVVAAVRIGEGDGAKLRQGGVGDSKKLSDDTVRKLAPAIRGQFACAVAALDPPFYNVEHARVRNLNPMLAALHARAIREVAEPGILVLVDQFANPRLVRDALGGLDVQLEQRPRAEREMAVAAASIVARDAWLTRLRELEEEVGVDLPKGAGEPVDRAARRFVEVHGFEGLDKVAKLHFKTTDKIRGGGSGSWGGRR